MVTFFANDKISFTVKLVLMSSITVSYTHLAAMELSEIEANKDKYLATGLDAVKNGKVGAILLARCV